MKIGTMRLTATMLGVVAILFGISGCPKKPQTVTETAPISGNRSAAPPPVEEVLPPQPPIVEERSFKPGPLAETGPSPLAEVYFEYDRSDITSAAKATLEQNAHWLTGHPNAKVRIEGHCDERGTNEYNLALGARRADAVKRVLAALGVSASRLSTISYGEEQPVCQEHTESCYSKNRRAHFAVL